MNDFLHIIDRVWLHFASAITLMFMVAIALRALNRALTRSGSKKGDWIPDSMQGTLITAGLTIFALSTLREAWDVSHGQSLIKAVTDYSSWLLGVGLAAWGLHRWHYFSWGDK